ncbi:Uncharacterised protein [uncultured archaeon]|nr:Uncharacterised protein [uncultured archaeon]
MFIFSRNILPVIQKFILLYYFNISGGFLELDFRLFFAAVLAHPCLPCFLEHFTDDILYRLSHFPQGFYLFQIFRFLVRGQEQCPAFPAGSTEYLAYKFCKTDMYHGCNELYMPEMTRTFTCPAAACFAPQTRVNYAEFGVHKTHLDGKTVVIICISSYDTRDAHFPEFLGGNQSEFYFFYSFWGCCCHDFLLHRILEHEPRRNAEGYYLVKQ